MSQSKLIARSALEQPRINTALREIAGHMPLSVRPVVNHILDAGGKRLRPMLTVMMARLFGHEGEDIYPVAASVELFHAATLLHDDVLDHADTRRTKAAAHQVFGTHAAILGGDAMLARACALLAAYEDPRLIHCLAGTLEHTVAGQISEMETLWQITDDLGGYLAMISGKTAWMIRAACEMGGIFAKASPEGQQAAAAYGHAVGMAFQIIDDALDYALPGTTGKPEGGDLREGKLTPPLLMYLQSLCPQEQKAFAARFEKRLIQPEEVRRVSEAIRNQGFDAATRSMAEAYLEEAESALECLKKLVPLRQEHELLAQVVHFVRTREV